MVNTKIKFYCVRCRKERPALNTSMTLLNNGAECHRGICMVCGTTMIKINNKQNEKN